MKVRQVLAALVAGCALGGFAESLYVDINDPNAADDSAPGRGTEALPYWSIQAAVAVARDGDTVWVKPGVYTNNTAKAPASSRAYAAGTSYAGRQDNRVVITNSITLCATGSAAETLIVGRRTAGESGEGDGTIRCVLVTETATNAIVKGFTLASGATRVDNYTVDCGGGFFALGGGTLVDCTVTNCGAYRASAQYGGTAVRCVYRGQTMRAWDTAVAWSCNMWNCAINHSYYQSSGAGEMTLMYVTNVNCAVYTTHSLPNKYGGCASYNLLSTAINANYSEVVSSAVAEENCVYKKDCAVQRHWVNPFLGDYRLFSGSSTAEGQGLAKWAVGDEAIIKLPAGIALTDLTGNDLSSLTGAIAAGPSQTSVLPPYGGVYVTSAATVNGVSLPDCGYLMATNWPCRWEIGYANNYRVLYWTREIKYSPTGDTTARLQLPPNLDGSFTIMPPKQQGQIYSLWPCTGELLWVDDESGSDETGAGTEANPYKTVVKALSAATSGYPRINVKPGVYDEGGVVDSDGVENRVAVPSGKSFQNILVFAVEGPEKTILYGATNETDNVRLVNLSTDRTFVQGFTLTGGRTTAASGGGMHGAAGQGRAHFVDCIVSNNVASGKIQSFNATSVLRTRYFDNQAGSYVVAGGSCYAFCAFAGNACPSGVVNSDNSPTLFNCSFANNDTGSASLLYAGGVFPNYCLFDAGGGLFTNTRTEIAQNLLWNASSASSYTSAFTVADPCFADGEANDLRVYTTSPAVNAGTYFDAATKMKNYSVYALQDVLGRPLALDAEGTVTMGAYSEGFVNGAKIAATFGGLAVTGAKIGSNVVEPGQTLTFTLSRGSDGVRPCLGVVVNNAETNLFADAVGGSITLTVDSDHPSCSVAALYGTDWYADAENGSDGNDGFTAQTAKKTLVAVMTNAYLYAGDTVWALPGTYDEGRVVEPNTGTSIYSRVEIPTGVSLVSTGGREVTVIKGANAEEPGPEARDVAPFNSFGVGLRATRCVFMNANTRLEGFTLTGGRCYVRWLGGSGYGYRINGSGVCAKAKTALVVNCDITDCVGVNGVAAYSGTLVNCRVTNCKGDENGSDGQHLFYAGPTLVNVLAYGTSSGTATYTGKGSIYNSTLIGGGQTATVTITEGANTSYNSLIYGGCAAACSYYNCVMASNATYQAYEGTAAFNPVNCHNCLFPAVKDVPVGTLYRPTGGAMLVDAGDNGYLYPLDSDTKWEVAGAPRVMNYDVDIGAYEYEGTLRADMKNCLGRSVASVGWISSNTVVNAESQVLLDRDGATLEAVFVAREGTGVLSVPATLTGEGTLTCTVDGVEKGTLAATGKLTIPDVAYGSTAVFTYTGSGTATLGILALRRGFVLILR